jgi:transcriptional regulator with XRE-family HTH domain
MPIGNTGDVIAVMPKPHVRPSLVGERLRKARRDREWNQSELAVRAAVPVSYVNKVETGTIQSPSAEYVGKLAAALGWSADELLHGASVRSDDTALIERIRAALGTSKAHLFESTFEALRELPPVERDHAIEVIYKLATNWPIRR